MDGFIQPGSTTENADNSVMQNQPINPRPILPIIIMSLVTGAAIMAGGIFGYQYLTAKKSNANEVSLPISSSTPTPSSQTSFVENDLETNDHNLVDDEDQVTKIIQRLIATESKISIEKVKIESIDIQGNFASGASRLMIDDEGGPGGGFIAAKVDSQWEIVEQFQEPPSCKLMRQYSVPISVYKSCLGK